MHELLSTPERVRILEEVLPKSTVGVEEVARKLDVSKGLVSKTLHLLVKHGIAAKKGESSTSLTLLKLGSLRGF